MRRMSQGGDEQQGGEEDQSFVKLGDRKFQDGDYKPIIEFLWKRLGTFASRYRYGVGEYKVNYDDINYVEFYNAANSTKIKIGIFARQFWDCMNTHGKTEAWISRHAWHLDLNYLEPDHKVRFGVTAYVSKVLYKNFENEGFLCTNLRLLYPSERCESFADSYERYKSGDASGEFEAEDYLAFERRKFWKLVKRGSLNAIADDFEIYEVDQALTKLGGPQLAAKFNSALQSLWMLHKLAFAFKSPWTIFRVARRAACNPKFTRLPPNLNGVQELSVAVMVHPGFRLRNNVIQAQVYPDLN